MATEIRDASGAVIGYQLEHTAQQIDTAIDGAMERSNYDPDSTVALAGGIPAYLTGVLNSLDREEVAY